MIRYYPVILPRVPLILAPGCTLLRTREAPLPSCSPHACGIHISLWGSPHRVASAPFRGHGSGHRPRHSCSSACPCHEGRGPRDGPPYGSGLLLHFFRLFRRVDDIRQPLPQAEAGPARDITCVGQYRECQENGQKQDSRRRNSVFSETVTAPGGGGGINRPPFSWRRREECRCTYINN